MRQQTLASNDFEKYRKQTRKEKFLQEMEELIPWRALCDAIKPFYSTPTGAGRRPIGVERMLRIHFLQHWFNLSDASVEEALYDMPAFRRFVGIDLGVEPSPDETTVCKFRHLLEAHALGDRLFALMNGYLQDNGFKLSRGTIVDASIIEATTSTKNKAKARDPEMHSTYKGKKWLFGIKLHIGMDSRSKLIHTAAVTPANVHDSQVLPDLLHGEETRVWGDAAYAGQKEAIAKKAPGAKDFTQGKGHRNHPLSEAKRASNRRKSRVRAKVEHSFRMFKRQFGFTKVPYRGLEKNACRLFVACALSNLVMVKSTLLRQSRRDWQGSYA